ncbi:MAG: non-hydrolyzing UDP-N-acetylglucosamine 2-epimerase [Candidatus Acidiferrales bacterium]
MTARSIEINQPGPTSVTWISIVGTRPQFIKLGPICRAIEAYNEQGRSPQVRHRIIHTGQHYDHDVADLLFEQMRIPRPDHNLKVGSGSHGTQLAKMIERLEAVLLSERPDWVINYGDTNSTLAGALVAARLHFAAAHVEAGCRSGQIAMPEEQARIVADHFSCLLLAPSRTAADNLRLEGIGIEGDPRNRKVAIVGDVTYDALLQNLDLANKLADQNLRRFGLQEKRYYLLTLHRAENTDRIEYIRAILDAAESLDLPVLFPVHPRTKNVLASNGMTLNGNLHVAMPLGYLEMLALEKHARGILTDSGGVQKEAFYLQVPCVTLRENTEWPETVELGANRLAGASRERIREAVTASRQAPQTSTPYGDGKAALKIIHELQEFSPS